MELPLAPSWMPIWVILLNTLILEVALLVVFYRLVVRRSANPRRARRVFAASLVLLVGAQSVVMIDLRADPRDEPYSRHFYGLGSSGCGHLMLGWNQSRILRRRVRPVVLVRVEHWLSDRRLFGDRAITLVAADDEVAYYGCGSSMVDRDFVSSLWPFVDAPDTPETKAALWRTLSASRLAATNAEIAAIASGA